MIPYEKTKIFVAGSSDCKISEEYNKATKNIGNYIIKKNHTLVFDGCYGLPGEVAKCMVEKHQKTIIDHRDEIINFNEIYWPEIMIAYDSWHYPQPKWGDLNLANLRIQSCRYQSEVTKTLVDWSDHMIFLKGNSGTLAELFHALDTKKNKEHNKSICILNINHQWDNLEALLKTLGLEELYHITYSTDKAIEYIENQIELSKIDIER